MVWAFWPQPDARPIRCPAGHCKAMSREGFSQKSTLLLGCFRGTFSPSRRQMRSTRLWFTCHPLLFSIPVISCGIHSARTLASAR